MIQYNLLTSYPTKNHQLMTTSSHIQILIKKRIYHPQLISNQNHLASILHFHINKVYQKLITIHQKTKLIFTTTILLIIPEDTHKIDTISAHNHEKTFSRRKGYNVTFSKILLKESFDFESNC